MTEAGLNLAIIPARKNSKRLPGKNMRLLHGKPLVQWTIEAAQKARSIDIVLLTTDDPEILQLGSELRLDACIDRPSHLATDEAKSSSVVLHVLDWAIARKMTINNLCLLQPTSPLRSHADIDAAFECQRQKNAVSVVSVCELDHPSAWCAPLAEDYSMRYFAQKIAGEKRSQDAEKEFRLNGAIYIHRQKTYKEMGGIAWEQSYAYVMSKERSVDIDDEFDLRFAEYLMHVGKNE